MHILIGIRILISPVLLLFLLSSLILFLIFSTLVTVLVFSLTLFPLSMVVGVAVGGVVSVIPTAARVFVVRPPRCGRFPITIFFLSERFWNSIVRRW